MSRLSKSGLALIGLKSQGRAHQLRLPGQHPVRASSTTAATAAIRKARTGLSSQFTLQSNGNFKFELFDQVDHDPPNDDCSIRSSTGSRIVSGSDENFDLQDNVPFVDITSLNFGALINATDFDGDSVNLARPAHHQDPGRRSRAR